MNDTNYTPDKIAAKESDYLYLAASQIANAGKGLYAAITIYENEVIAVFKGEILSDKEASLRAKNGEDGYFINMLDGTIMDSMHVKCFAKFANDAEGFVKTKFKNNAKITLDEDNRVCIAATRNIKVREEIFCGYGKKYWEKFKVQNS